MTETREFLRMVENALSVLDGEGGPMEDMTKLFDGFDPKMFEAEARDRWGGTPSYEESMRRTKGYKKEDWAALKVEQASVYDDMAALMQSGQPADGKEAMDVAERARLCIDRWFYPCSPTMHASLADLYESDPRFAANIDKHGKGLTPFLSTAIRANARRAP